MEKNNFGRELERKIELSLTLNEFKDLILYCLEDYLFQTKLNDKVTILDIPSLGLHFSTEQRYALDLRGFLNIPQISFDEKGCIYSNGEEGVYISPEFLAKCFIERVCDVLTSISKLYLPQINDKKDKNAKDISFNSDDKKKNVQNPFTHVDFIDAYNKLVYLKRVNENLTQGLIGLGPNFINGSKVINLRKIEIAAQIQKDIEFVINEIYQELYNQELCDFNNDSFYKSEVFETLEKEHQRLFRNGSFIDPLEQPEWEREEIKNDIYDEGTDEERKAWRLKYEKIKKEFEEKGLEAIKLNIYSNVFSLSEIAKRIIDYLKAKIYIYDYRRYQGAPGNPFINELGLDQTEYYAHPADKYLPDKLSGKYASDDIMDATAWDYDMLYGNTSNDYYDELDENYSFKL